MRNIIIAFALVIAGMCPLMAGCQTTRAADGQVTVQADLELLQLLIATAPGFIQATAPGLMDLYIEYRAAEAAEDMDAAAAKLEQILALIRELRSKGGAQ